MIHLLPKTIFSLIFFFTIFTKTLNGGKLNIIKPIYYKHSQKDIDAVRRLLQKKYGQFTKYFVNLEHMILAPAMSMHIHESILKEDPNIPADLISSIKHERRKLNNRKETQKHRDGIKTKKQAAEILLQLNNAE